MGRVRMQAKAVTGVFALLVASAWPALALDPTLVPWGVEEPHSAKLARAKWQDVLKGAPDHALGRLTDERRDLPGADEGHQVVLDAMRVQLPYVPDPPLLADNALILTSKFTPHLE